MFARTSPLLFLSYRRQDSFAASRWLAETIQTAFGDSSIFIDLDAIRTGDLWRQRIDDALQAASVLIAVIGTGWLRIADEFGRRRLDKEDDWVRNEIAFAIEKNLLVIPLLISGAKLPVKEAMPECLVPLLDYQAIELHDDQWESGRNLLLNRLETAGFVRTKRTDLPPIGRSDSDSKEVLLFDRQLRSLKTASELVYRARNAARSTHGALRSQDRQVSQTLRSVRLYHRAIEELLFEDRALLPNQLFEILHKLKGIVWRFCSLVDKWSEYDKQGFSRITIPLLEDIDGAYQWLDEEYESLIGAVQSYIGIKDVDC